MKIYYILLASHTEFLPMAKPRVKYGKGMDSVSELNFKIVENGASEKDRYLP